MASSAIKRICILGAPLLVHVTIKYGMGSSQKELSLLSVKGTRVNTPPGSRGGGRRIDQKHHSSPIGGDLCQSRFPGGIPLSPLRQPQLEWQCQPVQRLQIAGIAGFGMTAPI